MHNQTTSKAIFFDLDGTLLDTARDFAYAINLLLTKAEKPPLNFDLFRNELHGESKRMVSFAFNMTETHPDFERLRKDFLHTYHANCTQKTVFFPGMEALLNALDAKKIPWGIVTSKPTWLTTPIVEYFGLHERAVSIVMGDTLSTVKPDPAPLLYACQQAGIEPTQAIYVGDLETDVMAAKAAGMKSVGVTHGYHPPETQFSAWQADLVVDHPNEILPWMERAFS